MHTTNLTAAVLATVCFVLIAAPAPILADDYDGCWQGWQKYNVASDKFWPAIDLCSNAGDDVGQTPAQRNAIDRACRAKGTLCRQLAPEVGYAFCVRASRTGSAQQRADAVRIGQELQKVYNVCNAQ